MSSTSAQSLVQEESVGTDDRDLLVARWVSDSALADAAGIA
jgi:hypothetical protein